MPKWTYTGLYEVEQPELRRSWMPGQTRETFEGDVVPYPGYATQDDGAAVATAVEAQANEAMPETAPAESTQEQAPADAVAQEGGAE